MIDNRDNLNRPRVDDRGFGWGIPLGIAAVALVAGLLFFNSGTNRTTTATSTSPAITTPTPAPGNPAPARPTTGG
jgi:hypothetical protein